MLGSARAFWTSESSSRSTEEMTALRTPPSRMWRTSRRVSTPEIPTSSCRRIQSSKLSSAFSFE